VALSGGGTSAPTDSLSPAALTFPANGCRAAVGDSDRYVDQQRRREFDFDPNLGERGIHHLEQLHCNLGGKLQLHDRRGLCPNPDCSQSGTLTVADAVRTQTVSLVGSGVQPPALGVSPANLTFTGQQVGVASAPQTVTVSNTGGLSLANVGFQITGLSANSFSTGTTTCGATLAVGGNCTAQVIFTPSAAGGSTAALVVSSSTAAVAGCYGAADRHGAGSLPGSA